MQTEGQIASPTRTGREEQLQFLRFWAFFNVFVCHGEQWLFFKYPTSHCSTAAVSFFFMLSGLVTALASFNKDIRLSWREEGKYLWRKVKKIYPLYLFTTLYLFLYTNTESLTALFDVQRFPGQLVRNLLLVQSWSAEGAFSYNGVGWFLSTLMFLSVFSLPVMFLLNKINRRPKGWLLLSGALAGTLFLTAVYCYLTKNLDMDYWQYIFPPARMGEYLGGMLLGMLVCTLKPHLKQGNTVRIVFTVLEVGALGYWFFMLSRAGSPWRSRIFTWLLPNLVLIGVFTCGMGWVSSLFRWKPLVCLGDISFECFLIHNVFLVQYAVVHGNETLSQSENAAVFLFCLGMPILLAFLIHKFPEKRKKYRSNAGFIRKKHRTIRRSVFLITSGKDQRFF